MWGLLGKISPLLLAAPYAPFEYHALQRIAESRGMGVWGFDVDVVTF